MLCCFSTPLKSVTRKKQREWKAVYKMLSKSWHHLLRFKIWRWVGIDDMGSIPVLFPVVSQPPSSVWFQNQKTTKLFSSILPLPLSKVREHSYIASFSSTGIGRSYRWPFEKRSPAVSILRAHRVSLSKLGPKSLKIQRFRRLSISEGGCNQNDENWVK